MHNVYHQCQTRLETEQRRLILDDKPVSLVQGLAVHADLSVRNMDVGASSGFRLVLKCVAGFQKGTVEERILVRGDRTETAVRRHEPRITARHADEPSGFALFRVLG